MSGANYVNKPHKFPIKPDCNIILRMFTRIFGQRSEQRSVKVPDLSDSDRHVA
jgi:hypothetical protein